MDNSPVTPDVFDELILEHLKHCDIRAKLPRNAPNIRPNLYWCDVFSQVE